MDNSIKLTKKYLKNNLSVCESCKTEKSLYKFYNKEKKELNEICNVCYRKYINAKIFEDAISIILSKKEKLDKICK